MISLQNILLMQINLFVNIVTLVILLYTRNQNYLQYYVFTKFLLKMNENDSCVIFVPLVDNVHVRFCKF